MANNRYHWRPASDLRYANRAPSGRPAQSARWANEVERSWSWFRDLVLRGCGRLPDPYGRYHAASETQARPVKVADRHCVIPDPLKRAPISENYIELPSRETRAVCNIRFSLENNY